MSFLRNETRGSYYGINMVLLATQHTVLTFQLRSNICQTLNRLQLCGGSSKSGVSVARRLRSDCGRQVCYSRIFISIKISCPILWLLRLNFCANVELSNRANRIQPLPRIELRSQLTRLCFSACGSPPFFKRTRITKALEIS